MTYDDPLRLRVQKALTACLEAVTPTNGYTFDLSASVFRGRTLFGETDPLPMVSILEAPEAPDQLPSGSDNTKALGDWDLLLQGFVEDDLANPTDPAHKLAAEVRRALVGERRKRDLILVDSGNTLGIRGPNGVSRVADMKIGAPVVRPPDGEISAKAFFWMRLTLTLAEDLENPYA